MTVLYDHSIEKSIVNILANKSIFDIQDACQAYEEIKLTPNDFHHPEIGAIYGAIRDLLREAVPVDPLTVKDSLGKKGIPLSQELWSLITECTMSDNQHPAPEGLLENYADTLRDLSTRRSVASELLKKLELVKDLSVDVKSTASELSEKLIHVSTSGHRIQVLDDVSARILGELDEVQNGKKKPVADTGFPDLDAAIGGWQPTLIVIGGLPGVGKSALLAAGTRYRAKSGDNVGIISLEDDASWLAWRDLSREAGVNQFKMRWSVMSDSDYDKTAEGFKLLNGYARNIFISDGSEHGMNISDVVNDARAMILRHGVKSIWVDHIGEIGFNGEQARYDLEVASGFSKLRGIANRYGVPVIVFSHFKRRDGLGPGDEPKLTDFANSAGAERKARVALGLCRAPDSDKLGVCVLKNTFGRAGMRVDIPFIGAAAILKTIEPYDEQINSGKGYPRVSDVFGKATKEAGSVLR